MFVGIEDLLVLWKIWFYFLDSFYGVVFRRYDQKNLDVLDFVLVGERFEFFFDYDGGSCNVNGVCLL